MASKKEREGGKGRERERKRWRRRYLVANYDRLMVESASDDSIWTLTMLERKEEEKRPGGYPALEKEERGGRKRAWERKA